MSRLPVLAEQRLKLYMFLLSVVRCAENPPVAFRFHVVNNACKRPFSVLMMEPTRLIQIFPMNTHCTIHTLLISKPQKKFLGFRCTDFEPYRYFT
ncbi:hypothetical protein F5148DRAFT_1245611 [Russula earlei]|uniref:Uncharacterized protein n=1 Tax=Russula earlei TaxID=71964 RepID=A0ACC0TUI4_9AGAM|nr:hypothetical protein F5148DRAFT_1245611 [Russula earlei]